MGGRVSNLRYEGETKRVLRAERGEKDRNLRKLGRGC